MVRALPWPCRLTSALLTLSGKARLRSFQLSPHPRRDNPASHQRTFVEPRLAGAGFPDGKRVLFSANEQGHGPRKARCPDPGWREIPQPITRERTTITFCPSAGRPTGASHRTPPEGVCCTRVSGRPTRVRLWVGTGERTHFLGTYGRTLYIISPATCPLRSIKVDLEHGTKNIFGSS